MCLVCVCLILKKANTCTKYQFFNSRERIHLIFPFLLYVCSFLFLLFPFSSLSESRKRNPHPLSPSTQHLDPRLGFTFLESPLHLQHTKTQQRIKLLSLPTHHSKIQIQISPKLLVMILSKGLM